MHRDHSDIGLNTATFGAFTATAPATGLARGELASRPSLPLRTFATRGRNEAASGIPGDIDSPYELAFLRGGGKRGPPPSPLRPRRARIFGGYRDEEVALDYAAAGAGAESATV